MGLEPTSESAGGTFLSINGGKITTKSEEGAPGAKKREWTSPDGKESGVKWELRNDSVTGLITDLKFVDGKFGEELKVTLQDGPERFILSLKSDSDYFKNFAERIAGGDLTKLVTLAPYDFIGSDDKRKIGMNVHQEGTKLFSHFWDHEKKENLHGIPSGNFAELSKDERKILNIQIQMFLKKWIQSLEIPTLNK